jgi:putative nucleotidyltransferase with HDIG domain
LTDKKPQVVRLLEDGLDHSDLEDGDYPATETINLGSLIPEEVSSSGSFTVQGIQASSFGKLLQALPIPALLIDQTGAVMFANRACGKISPDYLTILGTQFSSLFADPFSARKAQQLIPQLFSTGRRQISEAVLQIDSVKIWGRMNFRSLRIGRERSVLLLVEDLTVEKRQIILNRKLREELEKRVGNRTAELKTTNVRLEKEIVERKRAEEALQKANEELELRVAQRTTEVLRGNEQLMEQISTRKLAEQRLKRSLNRLGAVLEETAGALASAVEKRDPYTAGHQKRVAKLACAIAEEMNLSEEQIQAIRVSGTLHDIGKISVPGEILSKPGDLTGLEFDMIKTHCQAGYEILRGIEFPWPVAEIVKQHHERMDGSGYPEGLKADKILVEAAVLAVADVVEAMYSHRPYRPAIGRERALSEIRENKGLLYHKRAVDACFRVLDNGFDLD